MQNSYKRIDAHLSNLGYCKRSEAKIFLKNNQVLCNNTRILNQSLKFFHHEITINDQALDDECLLIVLNKPKGYICSHNDSGKLIYSLLPKRYQNRNPVISTIGRLDIDTSGIILLTNDGSLNHKLTSPKNHVMKIYEVELENSLQGNEAEIFKSGNLVLKNEKKPLLPAKLEIIKPKLVRLHIGEGRYHQVKRMFSAVSNKVVNLHRIQFANFSLDSLKEGEFKIINNYHNSNI